MTAQVYLLSLRKWLTSATITRCRRSPCEACSQRSGAAALGAAAPASGRRPLLQPARQFGRRPLQALLQALHGLEQALAGQRLEQVVDRALLEGGERVRVVGGDEDDVRQALDALRQRQAVQPGQADVDEHDVRALLQHQGQAAVAVLGLAEQLQLRPQLGQAFAQALAR